MRNSIILSSYILLIICASCIKNSSNKIYHSIIKGNIQDHIFIDENINKELQVDSIFHDIIAIPLENSRKALLKRPQKIKIKYGKIFIQDGFDKLNIYSMNGKYFGQIGEKGRGPGEYMEIRDFDFDSEGNIYILDFCKIIKYSGSGEFIKKFSFEHSPKDNVTCNPYQFAVLSLNYFFVYSGTLSIDNSNKENEWYAMYKMNLDGTLTEGYFKLKFHIMAEPRVFSKYKDILIIDPLIGNDTIYAIKDEALTPRYFVDFGKYALKNEIPKDFASLSEFKAEISSNHFFDISNVSETDHWLYFEFHNSDYIFNVFYSKGNKNAYVSKCYPRAKDRIHPYFIYGVDGENFLSLIAAASLKEDMMRINNNSINIPTYQRKLFDIVNKINDNDNHVLLICRTIN